MLEWIDRACTVIDHVMGAAVVTLFAVMVIVGGAQVGNRFFFGLSLSWAEELQRYAHIWLVFFAIPIAYRLGSHIGVRILLDFLPQAARSVAKHLIDVLWFGMGAIIVSLALQVMQVARLQTSPGIEVRMDMVYLGILIGGGYMALCAARQLLGLRSAPPARQDI